MHILLDVLFVMMFNKCWHRFCVLFMRVVNACCVIAWKKEGAIATSIGSMPDCSMMGANVSHVLSL